MEFISVIGTYKSENKNRFAPIPGTLFGAPAPRIVLWSTARDMYTHDGVTGGILESEQTMANWIVGTKVVFFCGNKSTFRISLMPVGNEKVWINIRRYS